MKLSLQNLILFALMMIAGCENSAVNCNLTSILDEDLARMDFIYEGNRLTRIRLVTLWAASQPTNYNRLVYGQDDKVDSVIYEDRNAYAAISYDGAGRIDQVATSFDHRKYKYNEHGQLLRITRTSGTQATTCEYSYPGPSTSSYSQIKCQDLSGYEWEGSFTYDDHPNPLFGTPSVYFSWIFTEFFQPQNNFVRFNSIYGSHLYSYEYDASGYPTKSTSVAGGVRTFSRSCK